MELFLTIQLSNCIITVKLIIIESIHYDIQFQYEFVTLYFPFTVKSRVYRTPLKMKNPMLMENLSKKTGF